MPLVWRLLGFVPLPGLQVEVGGAGMGGISSAALGFQANFPLLRCRVERMAWGAWGVVLGLVRMRNFDEDGMCGDPN